MRDPGAGLVLRPQLGDVEPRAVDQRGDVPAEVAAGEEPSLHGVEPVLPPGHGRVGRQPVLEEVQRGPGPENPSYL